MQSTSQWEVLKRVLNYLKKYWFWMILSIVLAFISVVCTLYVPILIGKAMDLILGYQQVDFAGIYALFKTLIIIVCITALSQWIMTTINNKITYHVVQDIRNQAFEHIQHLPLSYLDIHPSGEIVSRMISDVDTFADGLLLGFTQLFKGVMTILGTLYFMITLKFSIAMVVVVLTPISLFVAKFIASRTYSMFKLQSQTRGRQTAFINEYIENEKVVQAFCREQKVIDQFDVINKDLADCSLKATFFSSLTNPCTRFVNSLVYGAVAFTGALSVLSGHMSIGGLTSFLSYANQYTKPFNEISGVVTELQNALACAGRVFDLIEIEEEIQDHEMTNFNTVEGNVDIEHVNFSYLKDHPLIEDFNLHVEKGKRIAIVGPTGCGKTTLINLLMRFYDVDSGTIKVDGHSIQDISRHQLRRNYGMVLQETWLKQGTIKENLLMAKPDASDEEVIEAAKNAYADSFIRRLPQGYDTFIGEDGGMLSQGQKQLLCIARVMLALPPMLILDEATSSIDILTEVRVQDAFKKMMEGRTTFIVAHRLSTIKEADQILVMNQGKIIETGNHDELLNKDGFYAHLYNSQFEK